MNATQVVIHFIGLVLFSTHVSNDPGLHAILPAIRQDLSPTHAENLPTHKALEGTPSSSPAAAPASVSAHIERHVALLVFPANIVVNDSWNASTVISRFPKAKELAAYKYVELTGEHVTFLGDAPNDFPAVIPQNMPRLPKRCTTGALTSGYQFPYLQAAAVVDIPEGTLSVCKKGEIDKGRIDTRLMLDTTGTLTVVAAKSGGVKTLVLNTTGNPTIFLANVPPPEEDGLAPAHNGSHHYLAYYRMIGTEETSTCQGPPHRSAGTPDMPDCPVTPGFPTAAPTTAVADGLFARLRHRIRALFHLVGTGGNDEPPQVNPTPSVNAECSNTQWP